MRIALIAAMDQQRTIGRDGRLPWKSLPADWENLRRVTAGRKMIMGRKSYDTPDRISSPEGNLVITRQAGYPVEAGFEVVSSLEAALERYRDEEEVFVLGGEEIFAQALPLGDVLYLTLVHDTFEGDAHFPPFSEADWRLTSRRDFRADAENPYDYSFLVYERVRP
jgi:dihydrofolate reductase